MENLSTYGQLRADIKNLLEYLENIAELERKGDKTQTIEAKLIFVQTLYWILKNSADIMGAELSQEWHEKWNECKTLLSQELLLSK